MILVQYRLGTEPPYHTVEVRCLSSLVGDTYRFVCSRDSYWCVASPVDDVGVPVTPEYSADDLTRVDSIKLRHRDAQELATFLTNLRLDLDEYVRTKKAMDDSKMHDAETYQIS